MRGNQMNKRQQKELMEMRSLAEKHVACIGVSLSKSMDDMNQTHVSLKSFSKKVYKKDAKLFPLIQDLKTKFYQCFMLDMKAYQKLYSELKVDQNVDMEGNVKKSLKSLRKETIKKFPNLFNSNRIKYDVIKHLGLEMND